MAHNPDSPDRRKRNRAILLAYCRGDRVDDIAAQAGMTGRQITNIAKAAGVLRPRGRPAIWPECPPEHRQAFHYLRERLPVAEARAQIEREIGGQC